MPSDISRKLFDKKKHYSGVINQQGRVNLDADLNEQLDIQQYRTHTETRDVIGASGVPKKGDSFKIIPNDDGSDLVISHGKMYVGGLLCELESDPEVTHFHQFYDPKKQKKEKKPKVTYLHQPYYPNPDISCFEVLDSQKIKSPLLKLNDGTYLVYIDAWQREINYLDDPLIQEVALGEADTTTRLQNVWQVKLLSVSSYDATCKTEFNEWKKLITPPTGKLNARTIKVNNSKDPCLLSPSSGYRRLENQLYRVEVQKSDGDLASTRFKWSRDNASIETKIESVNGSIITVTDVGKDKVLGFANGQWVEIVSDESTLKNTPSKLIQILVDPDTREITLPSSIPPDITGNLKLRRWDQSVPEATADGLPASSGWINLEDGVQVSFSEGTYQAGDYWLIPARTTTGEIEWPPYKIPNLSPVEQPPLGIKHYYCRLALLKVKSGKIEAFDCRPLFPSLTEICAEDICFDNNICEFPQAKNVQEALDLLCASNNLRDHNKYLHGFGVICGLKIKCGEKRTGVIIEKGSALDCDGNMVQVKNNNGLSYDLVDEARKKGLIDKDGNGHLCLSVARGANNNTAIFVENFIPQNYWDTVLEGTLLKDFYEDCIKTLIDFFKKQFPIPIKDVVPVPITQRRLTAFINLLFQLINSKTGPYGFISGNDGTGKIDDKKGLKSNLTEDKLLRDFYNNLKKILASKTFCAMFDEDDPYPEYILDDGLDTIFGTSFRLQTRLRLNPDGKYAYTCGKNNKVYVYDLGKKELIQLVDFPAGTDIVLEDLVISKDGKTIFCTGILNDKDSVLAQGAVGADGIIKWSGTSIVAGLKFVSLAVVSSGTLYGIAKGKGFYAIKGIGSSSFSSKNLKEFNATGLMIISEEYKRVVAADDQLNSLGIESSVFSRLIIFNVDYSEGSECYIPLSGNDTWNDITIFENTVFATGKNEKGSRVVVRYGLEKGNPVSTEIEIQNNSILRLATYTSSNKENFLLVTIANELKVVRVMLNKGEMKIDERFRIPVQPYPTDIAIDKKTNSGYVLNCFVNTLTAMNMPQVFFNKPSHDYTHEPPINLAIYRDKAIEAYKDVLSHILQHLKDCFCDKFLIDCPDCREEDKVYLGCVEVRNSQIYNICNFSKRKYVKSFRTVEYWLSTVPVLPILKQAFTKFCCTVPDIWAKKMG